MKRLLLHVFCLALLTSWTSCRVQKQSLSLELPATPILTSEFLWGVINRPYLKILESSDSSAALKGILRHGDIVKIVSKVAAERNRSYWFEIQVPESDITGWTPDENINIYNSFAQARTAQVGILVSK